ncbi:Ig-like domain-containing protein [Gallaecimonas pentaromativorans]|uniref:Ig-like domain-containing protein n=1 Tax=Gallaecimonas pentaromativorans TaxID=584787 RepID=UPI003A95ACED
MSRAWLWLGLLVAFAGSAKELVLVDAELAPQLNTEPGAEVRAISRLDQLPGALAGGQWDRVSLVSHGQPGALLLGGQSLDQAFLAKHPGFLDLWQNQLTAGAQLELWGCGVAQGQGHALVDSLSAALGRPVLASTDATGPASLGGNLRLEYGQGRVPDSAPLALLHQLLLSSSDSQDFESFAASSSSPNYPGNSGNFGAFTISSDAASTPGLWVLDSSLTNSGTKELYVTGYNGDVTTVTVKSTDGSEFKLNSLYFDVGIGGLAQRLTITAYRNGASQGSTNVDYTSTQFGTTSFSGISAFDNIDEIRITSNDGQPVDVSIDNINVSSLFDSDGNLTTGGGSEPSSIATNAGTTAALDFTLSDGGGSDGLAMTVSQVKVHVSGTSTTTERGNVAWTLTGPDISSPVTGSYSAGVVTFSGLTISVADGGGETYAVNANLGHSGITDGHTFILSLDGDTDLTVGGSGTQMGSTTAVSNGAGFAAGVVATKLAFTTQPAGSVSGGALSTQPVVAAQDGFDNTDTDFTGNVSLSEASAGTLSGTTTVAASGGVATFSNLVYTATADQEAFTLTAASGVLTDGTANSVTSDVVATKLLFSTQPAPTSIISGSATSFSTVPVVQAVDASNTRDTGYSTDVILSVTNTSGGVPAGTVDSLTGTGDTDGNSITVSLTPSTGSATFTGLALEYTNAGASDTLVLRASSGSLASTSSNTITSFSGPTVSAGNISVSGASGSGGAYKIGDTVTARWNNTSGGDNNSGVTSVTVDFSQFGGGAAVTASNNSGNWTATYTIVAGSIDATNRNVSVSATSGTGTSTTSGTNNVSVDNQAPIVTDANISISGASGPGPTFIVGDTVTATWNSTADSNTDITTVQVDFSAFGGGSAVVASNSGGTWTATYTITAGTIEASNRNVSVTATDDAGNSTTASDSTNAAVDNLPPAAPSTPVLATASDSGTQGDGLTNDNTPTLTGTGESGATVTIREGATDLGTATATGGNWSITTSTLSDGSHNLTAVQSDAAGNVSSPSAALSLTIDATAPSGYSVTVDQSVVNATNQTATSLTLAGAEVGAAYQLSISSSGGGTAVTASGTISSASEQISGLDVSSLPDGTLSYSLVLLDDAANSGAAATDTVLKDSAAPAGYSASFGASFVNIANQAAQSVTISGGENGADYQLNIASSGGGTPVTASGTLSGTSLTLNSLNFSGLADGTLSLSLVLTDPAGNAGAPATGSITKDTVAPTLQSSAPADNATDVALGVSPSLTFSEDMAPGTNGSNHITLTASNSTVVFDGAANGAAVSISGAEVSFTPSQELVPTLVHTLSVGADALTDLAGNPYGGGSFSFTAQDTTPVANNDSFALTEDTPAQLAVLANDAVVRGSFNNASLVVVTQPQHGTLSLNTGTGILTYSPEADYNGADSFTYQVQDSYGTLSNTATATLTLAAVNDPPRAADDVASLQAGAEITVDVLANDAEVDSGDSINAATLVIASKPEHGSASVQGGQIVYQADDDFTGVVTLRYQVGDTSQGALSNEATLTLTVLASGAPVANADAATLDEDTSLDIDVLANDSGNGLDANTLAVVVAPSHGAVSLVSGMLRYVPAADYFGSDSFSYRVADASGLTSSAATVTLTINPVNDAPVAVADTAVMVTTGAMDINVLGNDGDVDNAIGDLTIQFTGPPASGNLSLNGRLVHYQPVGSPVSDSFQYRLRDPSGALSAPVTVNIVASLPNQPPLAVDDQASTRQNEAVTINLLSNDSDADGSLDAPSLALVIAPAHGVATLQGSGQMLYTPSTGFHGDDTFSYQVADNQGALSNIAMVRVRVQRFNQLPVAQDDSQSVVAGVASNIDVLANDSDSDGSVVSAQLQQMPAHGSAVVQGDGSITYTALADYQGSDSFTYVAVDDEGGLSTPATVNLTVTPANAAPLISGTPASSVQQGASYRFAPTASDADGDSLTFSIQNKPAWASFDVATGVLAGTPGNANVGTSSNIVISVSDGTAVSSLPAFSITVINVNDAPTAQADSYGLLEGSLLTISAFEGVLANDSDPDGDTLSAQLLSGPAHATAFNLNSDGSFSYQHDGSEGSSDSFSYQVSDGQGGVASASVSLTINPVNDAPRFTSIAPTSAIAGATFSYQVVVEDPDSAVTLTLVTAPAWLTLEDNVLAGSVPGDASGQVTVELLASDGAKTATQRFVLTIAEPQQSLVGLTGTWQGLPAKIGRPLALVLSAQHQGGPALSGATLEVQLSGAAMSSISGCTLSGAVQRCPLALAVGAQQQWTLPISSQNQGDQTVLARVLDADGNPLSELTTDVTLAADALSQGDRAAVIAKATALALIHDQGQMLLVAGTSEGEGVTFYRFSGETLVAEASLDNLGHTRALAVLDWNQDGLEDLVVINSSGDASAIYLNQGGLRFSALQSLPYGRKVKVSDVDGDTYPDLLVGGQGLYLFRGNDGGTQAGLEVAKTPFIVKEFALWPDGRVLVTDGSELSLMALDTVADQTGGSVTSAPMMAALADDPATGQIRTLRVADLDGNGEAEAVASYGLDANGEGGGVAVLSDAGDGTMDTLTHVGDAAVDDLLVADFDGDGDLDLLAQHDNGSWQLMTNLGSASSFIANNQTLFHPDSLGLVGDFNGDGMADILLTDIGDGSWTIYDGLASLLLGPSADLALTSELTATSTQYQTRYQLRVQNNGPASVDQAVLTVQVPASVTVAQWPAGCTESQVGWQCSLGTLASGAEVQLTLLAQGNASLAKAQLGARVDGTAGDPDFSNNSTSDTLGQPWGLRYGVKGHGGALAWPWLLLLALAWYRRRPRTA